MVWVDVLSGGLGLDPLATYLDHELRKISEKLEHIVTLETEHLHVSDSNDTSVTLRGCDHAHTRAMGSQ